MEEENFEIDDSPGKAASESAEIYQDELGEESQKDKFKLITELLDMHYQFRFNLITRRIEFREHNSDEYVNFTDRDLNSIWVLSSKVGISCSKSFIKDFLNSNFVESYDPFRNYFDNLPQYDAKQDYIGNLISCFTLADETDEANFNKYFKIFLRGVVACAYDNQPNHTCLTFVGKQGIYKTTALNYLCPKILRDKYLFSGSIHGDKDSQARLSTCFILNNDEFSTFNKSSIETFKSLLTMKEIHIRLPYAHHAETLYRRASFVGSLNKVNFLNDTTGSRRFLIFEIDIIDINKLQDIDMDLVYSQAYFEYSSGEQFFLKQDDNLALQNTNSKYYKYYQIEELLMSRFRIPEEGESAKYLTATDIAEEIFRLLKRKPNESDIRKVGSFLTKHGFEQRRKRVNRIYNRYWVVKRININTKYEN